MPAILAPIGFGLINAVCHINGKSRNFPLVNLLSAMGGAGGTSQLKTLNFINGDQTICVGKFI